MIPAKKNRMFARWFRKQVEKRIHGQFGRVFLRGDKGVAEHLCNGSALVVSNHTSWWDPMMVILMGYTVWQTDGYAMMESVNLRKLPFLGRVGGFGVDLSDPADGRRVIRYGAELLSTPNRLVWVFPQGRERPPFVPLNDFKAGASLIARRAPLAQVYPVGFRYFMAHRELPDAYISVGPPVVSRANVADDIEAQQDAVAAQLQLIDDALLTETGVEKFRSIHDRQSGVWAKWSETILAKVTRYEDS